ncbi:MAG: AmmeMemoRadiSam system radical SAM enzyme [Candidatus Woesearchaeota archaeon]
MPGKAGFLYKKITRKDFLIKAGIAAGTIAIGAYGIKSLLNHENKPKQELWKWSKEAYYYTKGKVAHCRVCPNSCALSEGERSVCRVKTNLGGRLYTLVYGNPCAVNIDPIEKKPLFHFLPKSMIYSIATAGCTFRCKNCQNWQISQFPPEETTNMEMFPEDVVDNAVEKDSMSIAYTYSEPTAFYEYMYDTAKIAKQRGLKNVVVTNGSINEAPLRDLCKYLDAAQVDIKGWDEKTYMDLNSGRLKPVLDALKVYKEEGVWLEVSTLVVPGYSDNIDDIKSMSEWLYKNIGPDTPFHLLRFHPQYKLTHLPMTPVEKLNKARAVAIDAGLKFVYIGNVPGSEAQNTYCPRDNSICIERNGYLVKKINIDKEGFCRCGEKIAGVWKSGI